MSALGPPSPPAAAAAPLRQLGPGWFSIVMGLGGLAAAWHLAAPLMGPAADTAAAVILALALLVLALLAAGSLWRLLRHPDAWAEDLRHPMRHVMVATAPIAAMQVAGVAVALAGPQGAAAALWWAGSVGQFAVTVWVMGRWWRGNGAQGLSWAVMTPALFIPIVGNVLAPLGGLPLGHEAWSTAQFGVGLVLWPVVTAMILVRIAAQGLWPARAQPGIFIFIAPPAVVGLAALHYGAPPALVWMCWGMTIFSFLWVATQAASIARLPFGVGHWGMSFPLTAMASLTLRLTDDHAAMRVLAPALLALASLVILGLVAATLRGLRDGSLLAPEPPATVPIMAAG